MLLKSNSKEKLLDPQRYQVVPSVQYMLHSRMLSDQQNKHYLMQTLFTKDKLFHAMPQDSIQNHQFQGYRNDFTKIKLKAT